MPEKEKASYVHDRLKKGINKARKTASDEDGKTSSGQDRWEKVKKNYKIPQILVDELKKDAMKRTVDNDYKTVFESDILTELLSRHYDLNMPDHINR